MSKVLIVDDDLGIRTSLRRMLAYEGYTVREAVDGRQALAISLEELPDLVILDLMMPGVDGFEVCRRMREVDDVPILMLTAREGTTDQVSGLDAGADDYLVKPFVKEELLARIRALMRRRQPEARPRILRVGDLELDERAHQVRRGGQLVDLTMREFDLLQFFLRHAGEVVNHARVLAAIWGYSSSRVDEVYVGYLRAKLEAGGRSRIIHTVRGVGYVLRP
ncbi:MAG TPA: response regulator transcription factor [Candidatus Acidoferrales bacterium]|nr:response regulator transcription factor [Candidatus Acidoferrales bacterium]